MNKVNDVTSERFQTLSDEMTGELMDLVASFSRKHGLSSLSSTTLALQMIIYGLRQIGGPASLAYLHTTVDIHACRDERTAYKINVRARKAMEKMAAHFDEGQRAFAGRTLQ